MVLKSGLTLLVALLLSVGRAEAQPLDDLAVRGEIIANADAGATALRDQEPDGPRRRGFDIGMAAAEGQTLPGPSKQRIHDTLGSDEQAGFDTAVEYSLERNRNADLAAKGAAVARQDPTVARARAGQTDGFSLLGFDIASGIFGDPALGGRGNTQSGPGSQAIRAGLNAAGQRGFDASTRLLLSRTYQARSNGALDSTVTSPGRSADATALSTQAWLRVPDVVGMSRDAAARTLDAPLQRNILPLRYKETYYKIPDSSVGYGYVRATTPVAGTLLAPGSVVELQIQAAPTLVGIGTLGRSDVLRRDGFDLDTGRYEQMTHGADVILRQYNDGVENPSPSRTSVREVFIEPSDGAVVTGFDDLSFFNATEISSFDTYTKCASELNSGGRTRIEVLRGAGYTVCVMTSKQQIAAVRFRPDQQVCCGDDYKFEYALFPTPVKEVGRVRQTTPTSRRPICDLAAEARARNSPAASGLAAQCRAAGGPLPAAEAPVPPPDDAIPPP